MMLIGNIFFINSVARDVPKRNADPYGITIFNIKILLCFFRKVDWLQIDFRMWLNKYKHSIFSKIKIIKKPMMKSIWCFCINKSNSICCIWKLSIPTKEKSENPVSSDIDFIFFKICDSSTNNWSFRFSSKSGYWIKC